MHFSSVSKPAGHSVQNCFNASQCLCIAGGVRCKKFGIFISSALAYLLGGAMSFSWYPWRNGRGTEAGWKVRAPGHTDGQSWSIGISFDLGGGMFIWCVFCFSCMTLFFRGKSSSTRNSENGDKYIYLLFLAQQSEVHNRYQRSCSFGSEALECAARNLSVFGKLCMKFTSHPRFNNNMFTRTWTCIIL